MASVVSSRSESAKNFAEGRKWGGKTAFSLVGLAAIGLIIALIVSATLDTGMYYLTVDEYFDRLEGLSGERVRVNGEVVADSEVWDAQATRLQFKVQDADGSHALEVVYFGPRPDNFHSATSAILEGSMGVDGTFYADSLLTKCPSRYEEESSLVEVTN